MTENIVTRKQPTQLFENTAGGLREYNLKVLEIARNNANSAFDYAQQIVDVKAPSEMMELWTAHARKQFETLTVQTKELATLGQKLATASVEPLTSGIAKTFNKVA